MINFQSSEKLSASYDVLITVASLVDFFDLRDDFDLLDTGGFAISNKRKQNQISDNRKIKYFVQV